MEKTGGEVEIFRIASGEFAIGFDNAGELGVGAAARERNEAASVIVRKAEDGELNGSFILRVGGECQKHREGERPRELPSINLFHNYPPGNDGGWLATRFVGSGIRSSAAWLISTFTLRLASSKNSKRT